jgi:hypothetical protein
MSFQQFFIYFIIASFAFPLIACVIQLALAIVIACVDAVRGK